MYWQPEIETLGRAELEALQVRRLQTTVARVLAGVRFYQRKLADGQVGADQIRSLEDLRRLPFTTNADLRDHYPDGLLAVPREQVTRLHTSSGTTGKPRPCSSPGRTWTRRRS